MAWINVTLVLLLPVVLYWGALNDLRSARPPEDRGLGGDEAAD